MFLYPCKAPCDHFNDGRRYINALLIIISVIIIIINAIILGSQSMISQNFRIKMDGIGTNYLIVIVHTCVQLTEKERAYFLDYTLVKWILYYFNTLNIKNRPCRLPSAISCTGSKSYGSVFNWCISCNLLHLKSNGCFCCVILTICNKGSVSHDNVWGKRPIIRSNALAR